MAENSNISVEITAAIQGLLDGLRNATGAVKDGTEQMAGSFGNLGKIVDNLKTPFLALTGVLAGGALFKSTIDATTHWAGEVGKLAKSLGVTAESASVYAVALNSLGIPQEAMTSAVAAIARQVNTGAKGFDAYGVSVKNSDGSMRPALAIMNEALDVVRQYPPGLAQSTVGMQLFGKAWADVAPLVKMTSEEWDKARERAERLHLIIGKEGIAQGRAYERAMREIDEVWKSVRIQIGQQVMPVLLRLGEWMAENGPAIAEAFGTAFKWVIYVLDQTKTGIESLIFRFTGLVLAVSDGASAIGQAVTAAFKGKFGEAVNALQGGLATVRDDFRITGQAIDDLWSKADLRKIDLFSVKKVTTRPDDYTDQEAPAVKNLKKEKPEKDEKDTRLQQWKAELAAKKAEEGNWFTWSEEREKQFWQQKWQLTEFGSKAQQEIDLEIGRAGKQIVQQDHQERIAGLRVQLEEYRDNGEMRLKILAAIAAEETKLYGNASKQVQKVNQEIAKEQNEQAKKAAEIRQQWIKGMVEPVVNAMGGAFKSLVTGAKSFGQAMADVAKSILDMFINTIIKIGVQWVTSKIMEMVAGKAAAVSETAGNTAIAVSGAAASQAAIPIIGPALAMSAAGSMGAFLAGLTGPLLSAAGGYDIPGNINPIVQAHAGEMILPTKYADVIRSLADGSRAGGGTGDIYNVTIHAADAQSFADMLTRNATPFIKVIRQLERDGRF